MNKNLKRIFALLIACITLLGVCITGASAEDETGKLNVTKNIEWDTTSTESKKTAKVTVTSDVPTTQNTKVLFIGTLCSAHSLTKDTLINSINAIANNAEVKFYLLNDGNDIAKQGTVAYQGAMTTDQKNFSIVKGGNHASLAGFISVLTTELGTKEGVFNYDYIVMEFDSSRVADGASTSDVTSLAKVLKQYYDNDKVIWVTDGCSGASSSPKYGVTPYTPNNVYYTNSDSKTKYLTAAQMRMLCSVFAPSYYLEKTTVNTTNYGNGASSQSFTLGSDYRLTVGHKETSGIYAGHYADDSRQMYYNNADELADFLYMAIKGATLTFNDLIKVSDSDTVKVTNIKLSATTEDKTSASEVTSWTDLCELDVSSVKESELKTDESGVKYAEKASANGTIKVTAGNTDKSDNNLVTVSAVDMKNTIKWVKLEIELEDSEGFKSCITPKLGSDGKQVYDEKGNPVYVMNPNNGPAKVEAYTNGQSSGTAAATGENTAVAPVVNVYNITSSVSNGTQNYDTTTQKGTVDETSGYKVTTFEGDTATLTYKPSSGFSFSSITIDGSAVTLGTDGKASGTGYEVTKDADGNVTVTFANIFDDHTVAVVYAQAKKTLKFYKTWSDGWDGHASVQINVYDAADTAQATVLGTVTVTSANTSTNPATVDVDVKDSYTFKEVDADADYKFSYTQTGNVVALTNTYIVKPSDVKLSKTADRTEVNKGDKFNYTLTVYVDRTDVTAGAVIKDEIPAWLKIDRENATATLGTVSFEGQVCTWTLSELPKGESNKVTLVIPVEVTEENTDGKFVNTAKLTELNGKDVSEDPTAPKPEVTTNIPGFTVVKSVTLGGNAATTVNAGDTVTYSINVTNKASEDATVSFTDKLPAGLVILEDTISNNGTYDDTTTPATITWTGLEVEAGNSKTLIFNAKVPETLSAETTYANIAFVTKVGEEDYIGPGSEKNTPGEVELTAKPATEIKVVKDWSDGWDAHKTDTVEITVSANGTAIDEKLTLDYEHQSVEKSYPAVDAKGQDITYTIEEKAVSGYETSYAETTESGVKVFTVTNTYTVKPSDVKLGKSTSAATVKAGETFKYTLTVENTRTDVAATDVEIEDIIPQGLISISTTPEMGDSFVQDTENLQKYTWTIGTLDAGCSKSLEISVTVSENATATRYTNQSKLTKLGGNDVPDTSENPAPKSPVTTTDVLGFTISKDVKYNDVSVSGSSVYSGKTVSYSISVTNDNLDKAVEIEMVDEMPADLMPTNVTPEADPEYDDNDGVWKIVWKLTIAGGETKTFSYNAAIPQNLEECTEYTNLAFISSADGNTSYDGPGSKNNNPGTVTFSGVPAKVLTVSKTWSDKWNDTEEPIHQHTAVDIKLYADGIYKDTITFENDTEKELWVDKYNDDGEEIVYTFKEVGADENEIENGGMNGLYRFEYDQNAVNDDGIAEMSNAYQIQPDDLNFGKTATDTEGNVIATIKAGDTFVYVLTVENTRKYETAENVVVEDTLPAGLMVESVESPEGDSLERGKTEAGAEWFRWTAKINPGEESTLKFTVKVPNDATAAEYVNTAEIKKIGATSLPAGTKPSPAVKTTLRNFTVTKTWLDGSENALTGVNLPDVTVILLQNGEKFDEVVINSKNSWTYTWEELPMRDEKEELYVYTVDEIQVEGYTTGISYSGKSDVYGNAAALIKNTSKSITIHYELVPTDDDPSTDVPESETVSYGTEYDSADVPSAQYYAFYGWYLDKGCTEYFEDGTAIDDTIAPEGTLILYGKWIHKTSVITPVYIDNGQKPEGIEEPESWTLKQGQSYSAPDTPEEPAGYKFKGWYLDEECTVKCEGDTLESDVTIYGKWEKEQYATVSYKYISPMPVNANLPGTESVAVNQEYSATTPSGVTGCTFSGWYTDPECTIRYIDGTPITKDTVLYGKWTVAETTVTSSTTTTTRTSSTSSTSSTTSTTTSSTSGVKTSDETNIERYTVTCAVSASVCIAAATALKKSRKKKEEQ